MSSSLSGEMTTMEASTKRIERLFHVGRKGKFPHSLAKSVLMAERASSFLGTNNIEKFTNKLYCITLIQTRKDKSSNISRISERNNQRQQHHRQQDQITPLRRCFSSSGEQHYESEPPVKPESSLHHYEAVTVPRENKEGKSLDISRNKASTTQGIQSI